MKIFLSATLLFFGVAVSAQNNTNSPSTRYGYGALADKSFAGQRGMGGIGYGLRNRYMINPMNPASYSGVDSLTFMFEVGLAGQYAWFEENGAKATKLNGNLEYIAMQFSLMKKLGLGIGLEPVSYIGYEYGDTARLQHGEQELKSGVWRGSGGLNKVYASLGYNLTDNLAIGVKAAYLYGDVFHYIYGTFNLSSANSLIYADTLRTSGFSADFGLQYTHKIGKDKSLIAGLVYSPKMPINGNIRYREYSVNSSGAVDNVVRETITGDSLYQMPASYGFGFTYNKINKYTVGADVLYQQWSDAHSQFYDNASQLKDRLKINLGGEYIPNVMSNKFYNRMRYRAGLSYSDSYFKINNDATNHKDAGYKEYAAYLGFGFPMVDRRSFLNVTFQYSRVTPDIRQLINEQYFKFTISYTFNEEWFFKQKLR